MSRLQQTVISRTCSVRTIRHCWEPHRFVRPHRHGKMWHTANWETTSRAQLHANPKCSLRANANANLWHVHGCARLGGCRMLRLRAATFRPGVIALQTCRCVITVCVHRGAVCSNKKKPVPKRVSGSLALRLETHSKLKHKLGGPKNTL